MTDGSSTRGTVCDIRNNQVSGPEHAEFHIKPLAGCHLPAHGDLTPIDAVETTAPGCATAIHPLHRGCRAPAPGRGGCGLGPTWCREPLPHSRPPHRRNCSPVTPLPVAVPECSMEMATSSTNRETCNHPTGSPLSFWARLPRPRRILLPNEPERRLALAEFGANLGDLAGSWPHPG